jgi:hypothetical protein
MPQRDERGSESLRSGEVFVFGGRGDVVELNLEPGESQPGLGYACHCLVERSAAVDSITNSGWAARAERGRPTRWLEDELCPDEIN